MKRRILAITLGSLIALPAFAISDPGLANNEIDAGNLPKDVALTKTRDQVRDELIAAQIAGEVIVNAELGTLAAQPVQVAGKTREQVREELVEAQRAGDVVVNAELGLTAREEHPALYAGVRTDAKRVDLGSNMQ
ncbi:MAG TPA: DUF4148 domain-containing protein [Burkholderiales bacterium]|nr:DUF4148 domain-containing protein [Burkholderiales bacterium]